MRWRGFFQYLALQLPELAVASFALVWVCDWLEWPRWVAVVGVGLWIAKDMAMYPVVRRVFEMEAGDRVGAGRLIGQQGVAAEDIAPSGYVRVRGELWRAESTSGPEPIPRDARVRVREVRGLTLLIEREPAPSVKPGA